MQAASLATAKNYEREALDRIRRIGIMSAELEVRGKHKNQGLSGVMQGSVPSRWAEGVGEGGSDDYDSQPMGSSMTINDLVS